MNSGGQGCCSALTRGACCLLAALSRVLARLQGVGGIVHDTATARLRGGTVTAFWAWGSQTFRPGAM